MSERSWKVRHKSKEGDISKIMNTLVATDDSTFSEAVANAVVAQLKPENTTLMLLHVVEPFPLDVAEELGSKEFPDFDAARIKLRDQAKEFLARTTGKLRSAGFDIYCLLEEGDPRDTILDCAQRWPADIIIVGSHGRTGMNRFLLGSVSEAVARHAQCSVEIVRINAREGVEKSRLAGPR